MVPEVVSRSVGTSEGQILSFATLVETSTEVYFIQMLAYHKMGSFLLLTCSV